MTNYHVFSWIFIIIGMILVCIAAFILASPANYEPFLVKIRSILTCGTMSLIGGFLALCILRSSKDS